MNKKKVQGNRVILITPHQNMVNDTLGPFKHQINPISTSHGHSSYYQHYYSCNLVVILVTHMKLMSIKIP